MVSFDPSGDFESVCNDFHEQITLRVSGEDTTLSMAMSEPYTVHELEPSGAQVLRSGTLFVWSKSRSSQPPIGETIIDAEGTYWTIWKLTNKQHIETWEAFCLNLNILTADTNQAVVLKGAYGKGCANEAKVTWNGLWSGVEGGNSEDVAEAHFQPSEETAKLMFGAEVSAEIYRVYFEEPLPEELAGGEYRLVDPDGSVYSVLKYYNEGRIDRFPVAICRRITEGAGYHGSGS
jgi:hypothetical protein